MIFHENCLLADNSHEKSYLIFSKIWKDVGKFVVCCSCDLGFKGSVVNAETISLFHQRKEDGKDQESIQSNTTPVTHDTIWESDKNT